jgi:hypothetical protein
VKAVRRKKVESLKALLRRHEAFWKYEDLGVPLVRVQSGRSRSRFENVDVTPDMVDVEVLTPAVGLRDEGKQLVQGDLLHTECAFSRIPWMEAIVGCPIHCGADEAMWPGPVLGPNYEGVDDILPSEDNPWLLKLLDLTRALVAANDGSYLVTHTLMRGPIDLLSALIGDVRMGLALYDDPAQIAEILARATEAFLKVARAQYALLPPFEGGWAPWTYSLWAPGTVIRLQSDSASQLSPAMYAEQILPHDRAILGAFDYSILDLHSAGTLHLLPVLLEVEELDAISITLDPYESAPAVEALIPTLEGVLERKSVSLYGQMTVEELDRLKQALPTGCLAINAVVRG